MPLSIDDVHASCLPHEPCAHDSCLQMLHEQAAGRQNLHATQEIFASQIHNNGRAWAMGIMRPQIHMGSPAGCCIAAAIFQRVSFTEHTDAVLLILANIDVSASRG